jgi:hypothetical protein
MLGLVIVAVVLAIAWACPAVSAGFGLKNRAGKEKSNLSSMPSTA